MIKVDIAEIERLADILAKASYSSDDALNRLRHIFSEMENDVELSQYPQATVIKEILLYSIDAFNRGDDMLLSLKDVMAPVAEKYRETEKNNKDALNRMTAIMNTSAETFSSAIASETVINADNIKPISSQSVVQQLVKDSVEEMQASNIAATTKTDEKEEVENG